MTTSTTDATAPVAVAPPQGHRWEIAGDAWGRRALDWACLFEHYATDTIFAIFDLIGVGASTEYLDIACGSGLALRYADARGACVAGLDAAAPLIDIACARVPTGDIRVGNMFELPWDDESFDAVTSINGVWGDCEAALVEAHRVVRPGGRIGISFWGSEGRLDLRDCFKAFARNAPTDHLAGMKRTNAIARPGVAEDMLQTAGFTIVERGSRVSTLEWADADIAWRAISSIGPAVPALEHVGADALRPVVMEALDACRDDLGIYRFQNDHQFVVAEKAVS